MKYVFTENQVKKIIDTQINEQQMNVGSSITSSTSHLVSDKSFYQGMTNDLRKQTFTVTLVVSGKPIKTKTNQLLTKDMVIRPDDLLTFKPGDQIEVVSRSGSHVRIYGQNGRLMFGGMGA